MSTRLFQTSSPLINVMGKATLRAAQGLRRDFGEVEHLQVSLKGPRDFVSVADQKSEKVIHRELSKARPQFGFLMEESGAIAGTEDMTWVIDPLDGTSNFLHSIPHFCISVGLLKGQEPFAGVIYDPLKDEIFWAEKGMGAFMNGHRLRVSSRKKLSDSLIGISSPLPSPSTEPHPLLQETSVRIMGSAALDLAYVAAGRMDSYVGKNLQPWDLVAGFILVREAGGSVTNWNGNAPLLVQGEVLATNTHLSSTILPFLKQTSSTGSVA